MFWMKNHKLKLFRCLIAEYIIIMFYIHRLIHAVLSFNPVFTLH